MNFKTHQRQLLSGAIIFFYLIPFLLLVSYSVGLMSRNKSWLVLSLGLLLIATCALVLILLLSYWEKNLRKSLQTNLKDSFPSESKEPKVTSLDPHLHQDTHHSLFEYDPLKNGGEDLDLLESLHEYQTQNLKLLEEVERLRESSLQFSRENINLHTTAEKAIQDLEDYKLFSEEQLNQKNLQVSTLQKMMEDQRTEMETRKDQIQLLDSKVHDLSYEIKTLLHINNYEPEPVPHLTPISFKEEVPRQVLYELHPDAAPLTITLLKEKAPEVEVSFDHPIKTAGEAVALLKKCINNAQKLTGANYNSPEAQRYREFSPSHYTIEQRRLFENLRGEEAAIIIVYSPNENKVLFANQICKNVLGWSPEKFTSDFSLIIQEGISYWKKALSLLETTQESQARLLAKSKQGQETILNCHLGVIPAGLFRSYIIGVLYPA